MNFWRWLQMHDPLGHAATSIQREVQHLHQRGVCCLYIRLVPPGLAVGGDREGHFPAQHPLATMPGRRWRTGTPWMAEDRLTPEVWILPTTAVVWTCADCESTTSSTEPVPILPPD